MPNDDNPVGKEGEQVAQGWWQGKLAGEIADRQLSAGQDICPPAVFLKALETVLSRPVARLEVKTDLGRLRLRKEFRGELKPPTSKEFMSLLAADPRTMVLEDFERPEEDVQIKTLDAKEFLLFYEDLLDIRRVSRAIQGLPPDPVEKVGTVLAEALEDVPQLAKDQQASAFSRLTGAISTLPDGQPKTDLLAQASGVAAQIGESFPGGRPKIEPQQDEGGIRGHLEKKGLLTQGLEKLKNMLKPIQSRKRKNSLKRLKGER